MTEEYELSGGILRIHPGMRYVRGQSFAGREDIEKIIIPEGIGFFEEEAFSECPNLTEVSLPEGLVNIGVAAFADCGNLKTVNVPSTVKTIEDGAFLGCGALESISFPGSLEEICDLAFQETGLRAVSVPAGVKRIGEEAFFGCGELRRADVLGVDTLISLNAFGSCYMLTEGFIAPGFPVEESSSAELLYSMLWCSCPDRHSRETSHRAERFIRNNESLVMERVFKYNNIPALEGITERRLLKKENVDSYVRQALELQLPELTAMLLRLKEQLGTTEGEFEL